MVNTGMAAVFLTSESVSTVPTTVEGRLQISHPSKLNQTFLQSFNASDISLVTTAMTNKKLSRCLISRILLSLTCVNYHIIDAPVVWTRHWKNRWVRIKFGSGHDSA